MALPATALAAPAPAAGAGGGYQPAEGNAESKSPQHIY